MACFSCDYGLPLAFLISCVRLRENSAWAAVDLGSETVNKQAVLMVSEGSEQPQLIPAHLDPQVAFLVCKNVFL